MLKKYFTIRYILSYLLVLSVIFASYSTYYKIKHWGFSFTPKQTSDIWTIEAHINFNAINKPINMRFSAPEESNEYKILEENIIAKGYKVRTHRNKKNQRIITSGPKEGMQDIYYRAVLFDNIEGKGKADASRKPQVIQPVFDEAQVAIVKDILATTNSDPFKIIQLFNQTPPDGRVLSIYPERKSPKSTAETIVSLLALDNTYARLVRGLKLEENKKSFNPDIMLEVYKKGRWKLYNITTGEVGLPKDFVVFQRGDSYLLDIEGGENSTVKYSVIKSVAPSISLTSKRANLAKNKSLYDFSVYNLPIFEQNTLKWLSIYPLAILIIVLMRNVVGIQTMGTFTPMLLAMSLVKTGLLPGILCFSVIITIGLLIRFWLSKLNLLLVPRISSVVIFVILLMQIFTITGHHFNIEIALSAVFFPIIIMAWIIERASITWEEDGAFNASREIIFSLTVATITYFIISNEYIRHITFAFNEINLVILFIVMLLGTYTGYRLTELKRFAPLVKGQ